MRRLENVLERHHRWDTGSDDCSFRTLTEHCVRSWLLDGSALSTLERSDEHRLFRRLICYFLIRLANIVQMHSVIHHSSCRNWSLRTRIPNQYRFAMPADICHAIELVSDAKLLWNAQPEIFILAHSTMPCFSHYDPIMMYSFFWEQAEVLFCIMLLVT